MPDYYEFNLDLPDEFPEGNWEAYRNLIEEIRVTLTARTVHDIPVLPSEQDIPTQWIDLRLRTSDDYAVWFRTRADNLYLVGYSLDDRQHWYEFSGENGAAQNLISGSTNLGFSGSYDSLMNRRAGNWNWDQVNVGLFPLWNAVENLRSTDRQQRARSLQVVILMINEAIRLNQIKDFFTEHTEENVFPFEFVNQVHAWGNVSERVRELDESTDPSEITIPENSMGIQDLAMAILLLGIIKDSHVFLTEKRMLVESMRYRSTEQGKPLVELFSVTLNGTDGETLLYGMVTVTDGWLSQYIYDRSRDNPESIYAGDTILLSGPPRSISALDSFTINVDLADESKESTNDEVSYGQGSWNVYLTATNEYDKPLSVDVEGKNGSVTLTFVVLSNAVQATLDVVLINADGKDSAEVFGLITASSDKFSNESMLFWKTSNENDLQVATNGPIPLLRYAVAVPLDSTLTIRAELSYLDRDANATKKIANGTQAFAPYLSGTYTKNISGQYGEVQVKVTWENI